MELGEAAMRRVRVGAARKTLGGGGEYGGTNVFT